MPNKRKQLAALTIVAGLLAAPVTNTFAQSISPFGKGNPIELLAEQIDRLESRVRELEIPPIPKSLSGRYSVTTTGLCLDLWGKDSTWNGIDFEAWKAQGAINNNTWRAVGVTRIRLFTTTSTEDYTPSSILGEGTAIDRGDGKTIYIFDEQTVPTTGPNPTTSMLMIRSENCNSTYKMSQLNDGTFTKTTTSCTNTPWSSQFTLQGRVFDGGKTLILTSTTPVWEQERMQPNSGVERVCSRTQTARQIPN